MEKRKRKRFVNLTYHDIVLITQDGETVTIPPSGKIARVKFEPEVIDVVDGIPVVHIKYHDPVGLPEPEDGVYYLVSSTIKNAVGEKRPDVVATYSIERVNGKPAYAKGVRING